MNKVSIDVGVLLDKSHPLYENYSHVYDQAYGYMDEDQYETDFEAAVKDAKEYVMSGVDNTYAIIHEQGYYDTANVLYSVRKQNGKIIENFIQ